MNLSKARNEIIKLKKEIDNKTEPTLQNFFKYCEKYYNREVHCGEIWFDTYHIDGKEVKSDTLKFLRLSERYFKEIHQVRNPVKDGKHGLKGIASIDWVFLHNDGKSNQELDDYTMNEDKEFNQWFEDAWNDIIQKGNFRKFNQLFIDLDKQRNERNEYTMPNPKQRR